ncbi:hypothetical protein M8J76_003200 [Diaphorina citri]|nr:hypothetical protein M8J75_011206 [Diaphorina citri]KAI5716230.1 hypothetical protein M8J76_003200 [Diaphorina citri]
MLSFVRRLNPFRKQSLVPPPPQPPTHNIVTRSVQTELEGAFPILSEPSRTSNVEPIINHGVNSRKGINRLLHEFERENFAVATLMDQDGRIFFTIDLTEIIYQDEALENIVKVVQKSIRETSDKTLFNNNSDEISKKLKRHFLFESMKNLTGGQKNKVSLVLSESYHTVTDKTNAAQRNLAEKSGNMAAITQERKKPCISADEKEIKSLLYEAKSSLSPEVSTDLLESLRSSLATKIFKRIEKTIDSIKRKHRYHQEVEENANVSIVFSRHCNPVEVPRHRKENKASVEVPRHRKEHKASVEDPRHRKENKASVEVSRHRKEHKASVEVPRQRKENTASDQFKHHTRNARSVKRPQTRQNETRRLRTKSSRTLRKLPDSFTGNSSKTVQMENNSRSASNIDERKEIEKTRHCVVGRSSVPNPTLPPKFPSRTRNSKKVRSSSKIKKTQHHSDKSDASSTRKVAAFAMKSLKQKENSQRSNKEEPKVRMFSMRRDSAIRKYKLHKRPTKKSSNVKLLEDPVPVSAENTKKKKDKEDRKEIRGDLVREKLKEKSKRGEMKRRKFKKYDSDPEANDKKTKRKTRDVKPKHDACRKRKDERESVDKAHAAYSEDKNVVVLFKSNEPRQDTERSKRRKPKPERKRSRTKHGRDSYSSSEESHRCFLEDDSSDKMRFRPEEEYRKRLEAEAKIKSSEKLIAVISFGPT